MKCPFQWIEKDINLHFSDSTIRTRQFIECEGCKCHAYIPAETIKVGNMEAYIEESCGMFKMGRHEQNLL